jgi:hypothetical protein
MQVMFFQLLTTCTFSLVTTHPENIFISESDSKLQKTFFKLGVCTEPLSEEKFCLGSNALPVLITGAGLKPFVDKHKHLLNHLNHV